MKIKTIISFFVYIILVGILIVFYSEINSFIIENFENYFYNRAEYVYDKEQNFMLQSIILFISITLSIIQIIFFQKFFNFLMKSYKEKTIVFIFKQQKIGNLVFYGVIFFIFNLLIPILFCLFFICIFYIFTHCNLSNHFDNFDYTFFILIFSYFFTVIIFDKFLFSFFKKKLKKIFKRQYNI